MMTGRDPSAILDELLVAEARAGSSRAFAALVTRWTPRLTRHAEHTLAARDLASDAVQDAWVGIARGLRGLDDPARFPAWAYAVVTRRCVDIIRRRTRDRRLAASIANEARAVVPRAPDQADTGIDLTAAILRLPLDQRLMVSLFYGEGLSVEEIARAHDLPAGTVKSRLHAARAALKSILEGPDR